MLRWVAMEDIKITKPKPKAEMMKRLRNERKAKGLVKFEWYDTPENIAKIKAFIESMRT